MKLKRLRIEQFRKFAGTVEIDGLTQGLNVLHGPNETGKSTIAQAIRTLFFEKHNTKGEAFVGAISPRGAASPAPTIEAEFVLGTQACTVTKTFFVKPRAELRIDSERWSNAEADERLAATLGFGLSGKGSSRAETHGIPGLLWIEQGSSAALDEPVQHASDALEQRLKSVLGDIASTSGNALIAAIRTELGTLRTPTGRATGHLAASERELDSKRVECDALREQVERYAALSDTLARKVEQRDRLERERPWEHYEHEKRAAEARKAALEPEQRALETSQQRLRELNETIALLHDRNTGRSTDLAELARLRAQLATETESHQAMREASAAALQRKSARSEALGMAREQHAAAERQQRRRGLEREQQGLAAEIARIENALEKAAAAAASIDDARTRAAATRIDSADLNRLLDLERKRHDIGIQREAIATRIAYRLQPGVGIDAGELGRLEGTGNRHISAPVTLRIAGVGEIDISPGGEDIERLSAEAQALDAAIGQLCGQLGARDLAEAQARHAHFQELARQIEGEQKHRDTVLDGDSEDTWRERRAQAHGRASEIARLLGEIPPTEVEVSIESARHALDNAEIEYRTADQEHSERHAAYSAADYELGALRATIEREALRLESAEAVRAAEARSLEFRQAVARKDTLEKDIGQMEGALAARDPRLIDADIQRFNLALKQIQTERHELLIAISAHRSNLESLGAQGIDEKRLVAEEERARLQRRRDHFRLRADALDLLHTRIAQHQEAATQRLYGPLRNRLQHYLKILFPGTQSEVDIDRLRPSALQRNGARLPLAEHSHGTREQLGVLARFAYADLLREAGQPTLLILDDALVHSDSERRQQMKRILHDASQRHQILLFTCHPEDWRDAGALRMIDVAGLSTT